MATKQIKYEDFEFNVDMDCFDDYEFFALSDRLDKEPVLHADILKLAIGEAEFKKFETHFKKKDGRMKMSKIIGAVAAIFSAADPKD